MYVFILCICGCSSSEIFQQNLMKFIKDKCEVLHLGKHNPGVQHRLGSTQLGISSVDRDLSVLVDHHLNMSEQCAAVTKKYKAKSMLGCISKCIPSRDKEIISIVCSVLVRPQVLRSVVVPAIPKRCGQSGQG